MRSSRCGAAVLAVAGALLACSGAKPKTVASGAAVSSGDAEGVPVWPVRWLGWFPQNGFDNVVSPDGRWAIVTPLDPVTEPEPMLYRLGPDGPVAPLSAFAGTKVIYPRWLSDSRRVRLLLRGIPRDVDNRDATPAVLDLETLGLTHEKNYPFDPVEGISTAPNSDCGSASDEAPMLVCRSGRDFVVAERKGEKVERSGPTFACDSANSTFDLAPSGTAALARCKDELVILRPKVPIVRFTVDEKAGQLGVVVWGEGTRSVALGGKPKCAYDGKCADPGGPRVFDTASGREISPDGFRPDGAPWVVTALGSKLWADHRSEPLRRPLPGTPVLLYAWSARWLGETRVALQTTVRSDARGEWRELELELGTGRVLSSRTITPPERSPHRNPPWGALEGYPEEDEHGDIRPARIVHEGRTVATGYFLDQERDLISLRTGEHLIELFSEDGRRLGRLSEDAGTVPFLSPSGALGIQVRSAVTTLVRIATGEALSILLVKRGERTFGVVTSHAGWFAGDPEAFDALRFARGKKLLEAIPLTGTDVRSGFERPSLLGDFLAGRQVPVEPARPLKQAALGPVVVPTRPSSVEAPRAAPLPVTKAPPPPPASSASVDFPKKTWLVPFFGTYQHQAASWSPDGRFALLRQPGERAILFDAEPGVPIAGLPIVGDRHWAIWSRDGKRILAVDHRDGSRFTLVELATFERAVTWVLDPDPRKGEAAIPVGFLPDGKRFLARTTLGSARLLDASNGAPKGPEIATGERAVLALAWTHPFLAHAAPRGGFAVTDVETGTRLFTSERPMEAAVWLTTEPKLAVKSGLSTLVWDPKHGLVELDASGDVTWDRRGDRLALFTPDPTGQGEIDRCKDCLRPTRFSSVFDIATGRELESDEFSPGGRRYVLSDFSIFDVEKNEARPFPPGPNHPWGFFRWNGDAKVIKGSPRWTTTIALETGRVESWVEKDPHANLHWGKEAGTSVDGTKAAPRRPFTAASLMFATLSPSGRFVVGGGEPPGAILRVSDGAMLRLLVVETKERPYSVLVDEAGRYAGDDEAARYLSYATGTSLRDVTLANGLEVADRFRKPEAIRAFFR